MRRFRFRLETVLSYREAQETQREWELAEESRRAHAAEQALQVLRAQLEITIQERPLRGRHASFDDRALGNREHYLDSLLSAIHRQEEEVVVAWKRVEDRRMALVAASQARESVSRLHARDLTDYRTRMQHAEQNTLDEQATLRFARAQRARPLFGNRQEEDT